MGLIDWYCIFGMGVMAIIALWAISYWKKVADIADDRRGRTVEILERLVHATGDLEPTRVDANDPMRDRFVFCGRWTETGHRGACPWLAAVARVRGVAATGSADRAGREGEAK